MKFWLETLYQSPWNGRDGIEVKINGKCTMSDLIFPKIIPKFFEGTFQDFCSESFKNDDRNRATSTLQRGAF